MKLAFSVENDRHAGTMGWTDDPWYAPVSLFLERQHAPADARRRSASCTRSRRTTGSTPSSRSIVCCKAREDGIAWINEDLFRDGATVALLHTGDAAKARTAVRPDGRVRLTRSRMTSGCGCSGRTSSAKAATDRRRRRKTDDGRWKMEAREQRQLSRLPSCILHLPSSVVGPLRLHRRLRRMLREVARLHRRDLRGVDVLLHRRVHVGRP